MKVLFIGDIVGKLGRQVIKKQLPHLKHKYEPDLCLANAENLAHGKGVTQKTIKEMLNHGIDFLTSGNHILSNANGVEYLQQDNVPLIRPANLLGDIPGSGFGIIELNNNKILIINILGKVFIDENVDNPFKTMDHLLDLNKHEKPDIILVDFHAEATSEKQAMWHYLDGKVAAILGTHTHVATANPRISKKGTALCEDVGMVGGTDSIIGADKNIIMERFLTGEKRGFEPAESGPAVLNSVLLEIDEKNNTTKNIKRIDLILEA